MSKDKSDNQRIQVYVRCRPLHINEKKSGSLSVVDVIQARQEIVVRERLGDKEFSKKFTFDNVFGPDSNQLDVYNDVAKPCIDEVLQGYNCTIFAYGQTSTGKTHTMQGSKSAETNTWENDPDAGIIPRTLHHLFDELQRNHADYTVRVSFLELYNEELNDLLNTSECTTKLRLYEDISRKGSVVIQGLSELTVQSKDEFYDIMEMGTNRRQTASTAMNDQSSRSHTIFSITVHIKECTIDGEDLLKTGKLNLVDLAGSECIGRSGAVDRRAREAGNINQSLLTLGRVITALVEKTPHVPYRESKLTRLLQDSLGGRTKTSIIATVSPATCDLEETLSTLDYAYRAKDITNKPEINQKMTKKMLIREYTEEIERLRRDVMATAERKGICMSEASYINFQFRISSLEDDIKDKMSHFDALNEELEKMQIALDITKSEIDKISEALQENQEKLKETSSALEETLQTIHKTAAEREEQRHLVKCQVRTEQLLIDQSLKLISVADECTKDVGKLHDKLDRTKRLEIHNDKIANDFRAQFQKNLLQQDDLAEASTNKQHQLMASLLTSFNAQRQMYEDQTNSLRDVTTRLVAAHGEKLDRQFEGLSRKEERITDWISQSKSDSFMQKESAFAFETSYETNTITPLVAACRSLIGKRQSLVQRFEEKFNAKLAVLENTMRKHRTDVASVLKQLDEDLQPVLDSDHQQMTLCFASLQSLGTSNQISNEVLDEMQMKMQQFYAEMTSIQQRLLQQTPLKDKAFEQINSSLGHLKVSSESLPHVTDKNLVILEDKTVAFTQSMKEQTEGIIALVKEEADMDSEHGAELQSKFRDVDGEVNSHSAAVIQNYKNVHESIDAATNSYKDITEQHLQVQKIGLDDLNRAVQTACDEHADAMKEHERQNAEQCGFQKSIVAGMKAEMVDLRSAFGNSIHAQDQMVDRFLHGDLKQDVPTGETPRQREYPYSKDIAATSPHEIIVERFRKTAGEDLPKFSLLDLSLEVQENQAKCSIKKELAKHSSTRKRKPLRSHNDGSF